MPLKKYNDKDTIKYVNTLLKADYSDLLNYIQNEIDKIEEKEHDKRVKEILKNL